MFIKNKISFGIALVILIPLTAIISSCANRGGGPTGGPKDTIPPVPEKSIPYNDEVNYKNKKISIQFDEIVQLDKPSQKVVISPPPSELPIIKSVGKKITVELQDSLIDSTTYTIDFSNAIQDYNEKNVLENYSLSFSTGPNIDTLQISGTVIDASNLNPVSGILVGIQSDLSDTAFKTKPFNRITKTDQYGRFTVKNIQTGHYHIFALDDLGSNYRYDVPSEQIAYLDSVFTPTVKSEMRIDTVWTKVPGKEKQPNDSNIKRTVDTVLTHQVAHYFPDNIILEAFTNNVKKQYLVSRKRNQAQNFTFIFNDKLDSLPTIKALNFPFDGKYLLQKNADKDTLTYWLTDSAAWANDTLSMEVTYRKTDTLNQLSWQKDTMNLRFVEKKKSNKKNGLFGNETQKPKIEFAKISTNSSPKFDVYKPLIIKFETPTERTDSGKIILQSKVDTLWKDIPITLQKNDSIGLSYKIDYKWEPEQTYKVTIDSAVFRNIYGNPNAKFETKFTIKSLSDYANLIVNIDNYTGKEVIQLLDKSDKPIKTLAAKSQKTTFQYIDPGTYYMRLFIDKNGNGIWDTGDYDKNIQPEQVYYFPYTLSLRAYWDDEENWNYKEMPIMEQKPLELIQDKKNSKK